MQLTVVLEIPIPWLCLLREYGASVHLGVVFFPLGVLHGGQGGCLTWQLYCQNSNLAQRNFLNNQSIIDAKSIMLVPTLVCYLIFTLNWQRLSLLSYLCSVSSRNPEQIYHLPTDFCTCVALACALFWLILVLQLFQALITPKGRVPFKSSL